MTRQELLTRLKQHDWYHAMSDDHEVWKRGSADASALQAQLLLLDCPYSWWDIHRAIHDFNIEKYELQEDGKYRDPNWQYDCIASKSRSELLTKDEIDLILYWFNHEV